MLHILLLSEHRISRHTLCSFKKKFKPHYFFCKKVIKRSKSQTDLKNLIVPKVELDDDLTFVSKHMHLLRTLHCAEDRLWYIGHPSTVKCVSYFPLKCPLESQSLSGHFLSSSFGSVVEDSEDLLLISGFLRATGPLGPTFLLDRLSEIHMKK